MGAIAAQHGWIATDGCARCRICQIPLATKIVYSESAFGLGEKFGPGEKSDLARKLTQERSGDGASGLRRIRIWRSGCASLVPLHLVPYKVVHRIVDETAKMPHAQPHGSNRGGSSRDGSTRDAISGA